MYCNGTHSASSFGTVSAQARMVEQEPSRLGSTLVEHRSPVAALVRANSFDGVADQFVL